MTNYNRELPPCQVRVSVWIYEGSLRIEYRDTLLAQYQVDYDQRQKRLQDVNQPTLYQTPFASANGIIRVG